MDHPHVKLLSSRDPLSLPITTINFKRFVSIIRPVFWLQDRVEEIILWKMGPARTIIWMAAYTLWVSMFFILGFTAESYQVSSPMFSS